ncbi:MAG TPA: M20/M25/M40 family metallo-hydrolase [Solirubrobacteraceae bacterium]|nr:M20/M25/M40 family metallo-hydrolase [Solirubrobacteraceae bacterium]
MGGGRAAAITEAEITAAVAAETEWMVDVLERLVAAPTVLGAEEAGQVVMEQALRDVGLAPRDVWLDADALRADPGSSPFSWDVSAKRNVVATWEAAAEGGRSLILNGHVDVVPPAAAELWSSPPFVPRRDGDWLYGRGAGDMKAGLVAIAGAVRGLRSLGVAPCADVHLRSVVEEECTGNGALQCLLSGPVADGCVIAEPHPEYITTSQVGVLWAHVDIVGRPAHAAVASAAGFNAIDAASTVSLALSRLPLQFGCPTADNCSRRRGQTTDHSLLPCAISRRPKQRLCSTLRPAPCGCGSGGSVSRCRSGPRGATGGTPTARWWRCTRLCGEAFRSPLRSCEPRRIWPRTQVRSSARYSPTIGMALIVRLRPRSRFARSSGLSWTSYCPASSRSSAGMDLIRLRGRSRRAGRLNGWPEPGD